jgi:hypothetical protein
MKQKIFILLSAAAVICLFIFMNGVKDIHSSTPAEKTTVKTDNKLVISHTEIFGKLERPPVVFDHGLHSGKFRQEGCNTCHVAASEDNLNFEFPFKIAERSRQRVKDSYHQKCINCHNKMMNERKKSGPIRCGDCHRKESAYLSIKYPVFEFDFSYHRKHADKLKDKCILCHHIYNEELVYEEGTEQSCYYCHAEQKKRGPSLMIETGITLRKGLSIRNVSHSRCVNCHLGFSGRGEKSGPLECSKCHTGKYKTIAELANIQRPERSQPKEPLISVEGAKMKAVLFDHAYHEKHTKTCRTCHHETLQACKKCHGMKGIPEGRWIITSGAYHDMSSDFSCSGCHNNKKSEQNCSGCHHHLLDMDLKVKGSKKESCAVCHSGKKEGSGSKKPFPTNEMNAQKVPEKVTIRILEKQYEPSVFPHLKIIRKLSEVSNDSKMAVSFHRNMQTICNGCHHQSNTQAEAVKNKPPYCRNCHSLTFDQKNINRPRLLAAYHRQCMGCHEKMKIKATGCTDCHKEKTVMPNNILSGG